MQIKGGRATGVVCRGRFGREHVLEARREVILAAGAFGSPQLLMLSGIGPAEQLRALGIGVEVDAPEVGENLQDHPFNTVVCEVEADSLVDAEHPRYLAEWLLRRSGPLTSTVAEAFAFVRTRPGLPAPDVQYHFAPAYFVDHGAEEFDGHALTLGPVLITPKSRGRLWLRSSDPSEKPRILTNSLAEPEDVAAMVEGMQDRARADRPGAAELGRQARDLPGAGRAGTSRTTCASGSSCSTTRSAPAAWAPTTPPSSTPSCACAASTACAWPTPRSCR